MPGLHNQLPTPEPMPSRQAYESEREVRLERFPMCRDNYQRFQMASRGDSLLEYMPVKLDIENVSRCNFRCVMCQVSEWEGGKRAADMTFEHFASLIDENYGLVEIKLQGMGEPTLGKDAYIAMIRYARDQSIWVRTVTNASLLHREGFVEEFVSSGVNEIQVSVDGASKSVYEDIRVRGKFDRMVRNVRALNQECERQKRQITKMWTVVQPSNSVELEDMVRLSSDLGFTSLVFSLDVIGWGLPNWEQRNASLSAAGDFSVERGMRLVSLGESLGVKVAFWQTTEKFSTESPDRLCPWPFERSYVSSDLRIVPCCMIGDPDTLEIGKLVSDHTSSGFSEIWNGQQYQEFRLAHATGEIPQACQACYE